MAKYRTEKARELDNELKRVCKEHKMEVDRCSNLFYEYCKMEGKYGKKVCSPWDCGMGMRGFHYEYESAEDERRELEEREQFLIDNGYITREKLWEKYGDKIAELQNAFNLEQYGMTTEERNIYNRIKRYQKDLEELEEKANELRECIRECEKNLKKIKED